MSIRSIFAGALLAILLVACSGAAGPTFGILPGTREFGTAKVSIAPCEGTVEVSPIVPGADRLMF